MTDHKEEQELELEALTSIYPDEFSCKYATLLQIFITFSRAVFL